MAEGLAEKGNNFNCREYKYGSECNTANAHGYKVGFCSQYTQKTKAQTNADRIRSMTNEELSAFLCNMGQECYHCIATDYCSPGHTGMLDWLKDEVKE